MLPHHVHYSHFPQFDTLEQVLLNWPKLFDEPPVGTQPLHVEHDTAIILCISDEWVRHIEEHHDVLVAQLQKMIAGDLKLRFEKIRPVLATPTEIFLARQNVVIFSKLRDLELGF